MRAFLYTPVFSGLFLIASCFAVPTLAQAQSSLQSAGPLLPAGQTILNISATERISVQQDLLIANLRVEKTGADTQTLQNEINKLMKESVEKAKKHAAIKVSTGQYYVYQDHSGPAPLDKDKEQAATPKNWRGVQSLELQSMSADDLLLLVGDLQASGLVVGGLSYTLSPDKADEAKDSLMEKALAKVTTRAERAAKAMDKGEMALIEVNIDASDTMMMRPYAMRAMAMDSAVAEMAPPVATAGETEITLTVSAKALLKP